MTKTLACAASALLALTLAGCAGVPPELADNESIKCRSVRITGSAIPKRDCRKVEDWAKHDQMEAERNNEMLDRARQNMDSGG